MSSFKVGDKVKIKKLYSHKSWYRPDCFVIEGFTESFGDAILYPNLWFPYKTDDAKIDVEYLEPVNYHTQHFEQFYDHNV